MRKLLFEQVPKCQCGVGIIETILQSSTFTQPHTHDFCEIFFIKDGSLIHNKNNVQSIMNKWDFCLIDKQDIHCFKKNSASPTVFVNISFPQEFLSNILNELNIGENDCNFINQGTLDLSLVDFIQNTLSLLTSAKDNTVQQKILLESCLKSIFLTQILSRNDDHTLAPIWLKETIKSLKEPEILAKGISGLIEKCGYTQEHLTRQTQKYYKQTPSQIINKARIDEAQRLLRTTTLPVLTIALQLGYDNVSYFNRLFSKQVGLSPTQYRNKIKFEIY